MSHITHVIRFLAVIQQHFLANKINSTMKGGKGCTVPNPSCLANDIQRLRVMELLPKYLVTFCSSYVMYICNVYKLFTQRKSFRPAYTKTDFRLRTKKRKEL